MWWLSIINLAEAGRFHGVFLAPTANLDEALTSLREVDGLPGHAEVEGTLLALSDVRIPVTLIGRLLSRSEAHEAMEYTRQDAVQVMDMQKRRFCTGVAEA